MKVKYDIAYNKWANGWEGEYQLGEDWEEEVKDEEEAQKKAEEAINDMDWKEMIDYKNEEEMQKAIEESDGYNTLWIVNVYKYDEEEEEYDYIDPIARATKFESDVLKEMLGYDD